MPVKWTADKDQMLLLKLLETHDMKLDTAKIAEAWPDTMGDKPTARAITEHLVKIRDQARKNGSLTGIAVKSVVSTPRKSTGASSTTTPRSAAKSVKESGSTTTTPSKYGMRVEDDNSGDDVKPAIPDLEHEVKPVIKKEPGRNPKSMSNMPPSSNGMGRGSKRGRGNIIDLEDGEPEIPFKRQKVQAAQPQVHQDDAYDDEALA